MELPLAKRIRKQAHKDIALVQDMIVERLLKHMPGSVFHGGTCIWRCYNGNRFSDRLDFYLPRKGLDGFFSDLEKRGFVIGKKKISENSVYSKLTYQRTQVRVEGTFQKKGSVLADYEKINGMIISILALSQEELLREKAVTYQKRGKIRDLYDVFFLLRYVDALKVKPELKELIRSYQNPVDEKDLKAIILQGLVPTSDKMIGYIKRKCQSI